MINIQIPANTKAISQRETLRMADMLAKALSSLVGVSGFVPDSTGQQQAEKAVDEAEKKVRQRLKRDVQGVIEFLKKSTPKATGKTRAGWQLYVVDMPRGTEYTIMHDNKKLIDWLNFGTKRHGIAPSNASVLHFKIGNKDIFAKHVNHPGTPALGFVDKARGMMRTIISKAATICL